MNFDNTAFETMGRVDPCPETCSVSNSVSTPEIGDKNLLGLDLGTKTGYGCRRRDGRVIYGTEVFTPKKTWTPGQRGLRFQSWLSAFVHENQVDRIAYEEVVRAHVSTDAAHLYGLFEGLVWMVADRCRIQVLPVSVSTVKKAWTGWGDASKDGMIAEARRRGFRPDTDNAADGLAILDWAVLEESGGKVRLGDGSMPDPKTVQRRPRKAKPTTPNLF